MIRTYTLRAFAARARRAALTALIVAAGVAMITGTFVFTDTIHGAFRQLFAGSDQGAAVIVSGRRALASDPSSGASIPITLVRRIRRLPGVAAAEGQVTDVATIVGRAGGPIGVGRLPTAALSYLGPPFQGVRIVRGSAPKGPGEVVLDTRTAASQGYRLGDLVPVVTGQPVRRFRLTGLATLGDTSVGGEAFAVFSLTTAQSLYGKTRVVDRMEVALAPAATATQVMRELRPLLGPGLVASPRVAAADAEVRRVSARFASLNGGLLAFALVAVVVGALLVFNSFSITASQRASELSLLRALGATRAQVFGSSLLEAALIGVAGTVIGLVLGPLAALAIRAVFDAAGSGLPGGSLVLRTRTGLIGLGAGAGAVGLAALIPVLRATRAAPIEALRTSVVPRRGRRPLIVRGLVAGALGLGGLAVILTATGATSERLRTSVIGGAIVVLAVLIASPLAVRSLAQIVTWPLGRRDSVVARLARDQAVRLPGRTAVSASSLTLGLALVLLLSAYAGGLQAAAGDAIRQTFAGDLAIESQDGTSSVPAASVRAATSVPGLLGVASLKTAAADLGAANGVEVNGVEPSAWGSVYRFDWVRGSSASLAGLGVGEVLIEQDAARAAHLKVGGHAILLTGGGARVDATVAGIYRDAGLLRGVTLDAGWFDRLFHQSRLRAAFIRLAPGSDVAAARTALAGSLRAFPGVVARSQSQLAASARRGVSSVTGLFYALLVLSLLMSLVGIVGTLNLSVHERTRELGILRALGMSADQARTLVRDESLISAGVGSVTGAALGLLLAWAVARGLSPEGFVFSVPWPALLMVLVAGGLAGALAAVGPGRRAAQLDILAAIAHE